MTIKPAIALMMFLGALNLLMNHRGVFSALVDVTD
jgi:hypothetical protein